MKLRKILCVVCCCLLLEGLSSTALAASVTIHIGGGPGVNNLSESEYISDIAESNGWLYFMVTDRETGYQTKIICSAVNDVDNTAVYTPERVGGSARQHFVSMEPAASGGLWIHMEDGPEVDADICVVLFQNGQPAARQQCTGRAKLSAEGAVWKDDAELVCWDGARLTRYPISTPLNMMGGFALWNGKPCYEDWSGSGRVLACQADGQASEIFSLPEGVRFSETSLFPCAGELYLSYRTDTGGQRTVRVSDGKQISGKFYPVGRVRLQPDGTMQLMAAESMTNTVTFTQVSIFNDALTERRVGEYLVTADVKMNELGADGLPVGWRFTDSVGNEWIYSGEVGRTAAVTKVTADGTTVSYTAEALSGFALYHKGTGVSFDVEPYITDTGFTIVPARGVAYLLNADITWDGITQTVTVRHGEHTILLTIGSMTALVDDTEVSLGTPAAIVGGRTMLPLRFLTETLGGTIRWENGAVYID